jgi:hypothetical protein
MRGFSGRGSRSKRSTEYIDDAADAAAADKEYWHRREAANASDDADDDLMGRDRRDPHREPERARRTTRRNPIGDYNIGEDWKPDSPPRPPNHIKRAAGLGTVMTVAALLAGASSMISDKQKRLDALTEARVQTALLNNAKYKGTKLANKMVNIGPGSHLPRDESVQFEKLMIDTFGRDHWGNVIRPLTRHQKGAWSEERNEFLYEGDKRVYTKDEIVTAQEHIALNIKMNKELKRSLMTKAALERKKGRKEAKNSKAMTKQNKRRARGGRQNTRKKKR